MQIVFERVRGPVVGRHGGQISQGLRWEENSLLISACRTVALSVRGEPSKTESPASLLGSGRGISANLHSTADYSERLPSRRACFRTASGAQIGQTRYLLSH